MEVQAEFDATVLSLIAAEVPPDAPTVEIRRETLLKDELGIGSLAIASLLFALEDVFDVDIANVDLQLAMDQLHTVGDAVDACRRIVELATAARGP